MTELSDWDFPIPEPVIALWLSLLESIVAVGVLAFAVALLERGGILPNLQIPGGAAVFGGAILLATTVVTLARLGRLPKS